MGCELLPLWKNIMRINSMHILTGLNDGEKVGMNVSCSVYNVEMQKWHEGELFLRKKLQSAFNADSRVIK
jgi:hypothetical protein